MSPRLELRLDDPSVDELRDWASLWGDLMHVDMTLQAREGISKAPGTVFIRRALWESAVVSYGRTALSGRRQQKVDGLLDSLGPAARAFHREVMQWRNQHVAHRVDESREQTEARAIVDQDKREILGIRVKVNPVFGPEDEDDDLAVRFKAYVEELRNLVWSQRMEPAERRATSANSARITELIATGGVPNLIRDDGVSLDIDPSGQTED